MSLFTNAIRSVLVFFKYRGVRFGSVGSGAVFKAVSSNYLNSRKISLGRNVHIGPRALIDGAGGVVVGEGSIVAPGVTIYSRTHNFDENLTALPFDNVMLVAPVSVGRYVWIRAQVTILPGVHIGDGAIIGAGSVVSKDVPAGAIVVGNPGRVVRYRDMETFERLCAEDGVFVYEKHGHQKIFKSKIDRPAFVRR